MKGVKEGENGVKEVVERVMNKLGVEIKIDDIRKIEAGWKERGGMVVVRVDSEEERRDIKK